MGEAEDPKEELDFYFKLANPLALSLPDAEEKSRAAAWLHWLGDADAGAVRMRADYLRLLVFALQRRRLVGVFAAPPDMSQPLQPFQGGASLSEMMRRLGTQAAAERGAGDRPAVSAMLSHDLKHFLAVQPLPHDRGAHCYMALSPDSYPNWAAKPRERSRRRSAPGQLQCACTPEPPPPSCSPQACSTPVRNPCECAPPPPTAPARRCAPAPPTPRACACPPDQICWCPQEVANVASPCPGYRSSSYDVDSVEDPMVFSWMSKPETSAAAQEAALRALSDACEDSSVRLPALWQSEESGFEPMEWDSYQRGNYQPDRAGEYGGGRVFTTASRMEVRRSEERLPDGSVLATEERTAAGAATRLCPPPPGSCPASPPRGASAAVGATQRRVTWSPPPATSTPCPAARRRPALPPCSPPSPIRRRSRTRSPCSMTPDSLRSMTPDSLEVSRCRRRSTRSPRSPRRSYSAESIVPCPGGRQVDSVSPPSALRFSGSPGLSPCTCGSPKPCPASRRRTSSPFSICPASPEIDDETPPSGLFDNSSCLCSPRSPKPCPASRRRTSSICPASREIDDETPPSGLFDNSSCLCSPSGIDDETAPSGLFSGSPCICSSRRRSSSPPPCAPPPCSPDPYGKVKQPERFFSLPKGRRSSTSPPCAPSPCASAPCKPSPCAPAPCSPDPYANVGRPSRFFSSPKGRRSSTPPCAPSPPPCKPSPCAPPPCSPDPYCKIGQPKRFFSPLAELAKSASMEYDEDPFYGLSKSGGSDSCPCGTPSPCPCPKTPSPSPTPCPARLRGSVPKSFYKLTDDSPPMSTPRRTAPCPAARQSYKPRRVCGSSPPPAACPATTSCEVEQTPSGTVRRSFSQDCPGAPLDATQGPVSRGASASFAMSSCSPSPDPTEFKWGNDDVPMWEDLEDPEPEALAGKEDAFDFLDRDRSCARFDFPPDDTFYEFETQPCPAAESTRYLDRTTSRSRSPSPSISRSRSPSPSLSRSRSPSPDERRSSICSPPRGLSRWRKMSDMCANQPSTLSSSPMSSCCRGSSSPGRPSSPSDVIMSPRASSPVPEGWVRVPSQPPLGPWVDPGPMWQHVADPVDNSIDCDRDISGEGPWAILDRTVPSFSFPPIHPRRRRRC